MHHSLHKLSVFLSVPLLELMVACGVDPEALQNKEMDEGGDDEKQATDTQLAAEHTVKAILQVEDGLSAVEGSFELIRCTGQVDHGFVENKVSLPDDAMGCRVAISHLTLGDRGFHISDELAEWKTGDVLHFKADDGSPEGLDVHVDHQLSHAPSPTENAYFTVSRSQATSSAESQTLLAANMEGSIAPHFRIRKTDFVGMSATGAGKFVFHLDCLVGIQTKGATGPACHGMPLSEIRYMLVKDDYDSELSFAEAEALFAERSSFVVDEKIDFEPIKADQKQMGGFVTKSGDQVLEGPDQMHDNPNMLLILQGPGPSYQYFNVDVVFTSH